MLDHIWNEKNTKLKDFWNWRIMSLLFALLKWKKNWSDNIYSLNYLFYAGITSRAWTRIVHWWLSTNLPLDALFPPTEQWAGQVRTEYTFCLLRGLYCTKRNICGEIRWQGTRGKRWGQGYILCFFYWIVGGGSYSLLTFHQIYSFRLSYKSFITIMVQDWFFFQFRRFSIYKLLKG